MGGARVPANHDSVRAWRLAQRRRSDDANAAHGQVSLKLVTRMLGFGVGVGVTGVGAVAAVEGAEDGPDGDPPIR